MVGVAVTDTHKTFESRENTVISCLVTPLHSVGTIPKVNGDLNSS